MNTKINIISKTIRNKPITNKLMSYIIRAVLYPAIEYQTQSIYLSKPEAKKLDSKIRSFVPKLTLVDLQTPRQFTIQTSMRSQDSRTFSSWQEQLNSYSISTIQ